MSVERPVVMGLKERISIWLETSDSIGITKKEIAGTGWRWDTHKKCCGQCHKCYIFTEEESRIVFDRIVFKTITECLEKIKSETLVKIQELTKDGSKLLFFVNSLWNSQFLREEAPLGSNRAKNVSHKNVRKLLAECACINFQELCSLWHWFPSLFQRTGQCTLAGWDSSGCVHDFLWVLHRYADFYAK